MNVNRIDKNKLEKALLFSNHSLIFIYFFWIMKKLFLLSTILILATSVYANTTGVTIDAGDPNNIYPKILVIDSVANDPFYTWDINTTSYDILSQYPMVRVIENVAWEPENVLKNATEDDTWNVNTGNVTEHEDIDITDDKNESNVTDKWEDNDSIFAGWYESITNDPEFLLAMNWMYQNGLTKYDTEEAYRPFDNLTREESSKMFAQAFSTFGYADVVKNTDCSFNDEDEFNPELKDYIKKVCELWLFQWHEWNYYPTTTLSKAQATAVMIRMFEGKFSYEDKNPWWADYYKKAFAIGITNIDNINYYDKDLSRYEIALMLYRFRNLLLDEQEKADAEDKIDTINKNTNNDWEWNSSIWSGDTWKLEDLYDSEAIKNDPELIDAIAWMKDNWITNATWVDSFNSFNIIKRAEFAVMIDKFSDIFGLWEIKDEYIGDACTFSDISELDSMTQIGITNTCKKNLMWGVDWEFDPSREMTMSEVVVSLVRVINNWKKLSEDSNPWWANYYEKAVEVWLVSPGELANFENKLTRYQTALLMYRFYNKNLIAGSLDNNESNILINIWEPVLTWEIRYIDFDKNIFENWDVLISYIDVNWVKYKVVKTLEKDYLTNSFVWYADIFDLVDDDKVGNMSVVFSNGSIVESNIRINNQTIKIYYDEELNKLVTV